jgi:hypothetical protein
MSSTPTQTTPSACVADEVRIAEAITNTSRRRDVLAVTLPELSSKFQSARNAYEANVQHNLKAVFPRAEREAIGAAEAEIASLDAVLIELRAKLDQARRSTKLAEMKALEARELADLAALCKALEPALAINDRLKREHDQAGSMHRSLALPWLDQALIDGLRTFAVKGQNQPASARKLPRGHSNVIFTKNFPGSFLGTELGPLCSYVADEVANFPRRIVDVLVKAGYATEVQS